MTAHLRNWGFLIGLLAGFSPALWAQAPEVSDFIDQQFQQSPPTKQLLWLTGSRKALAQTVLGHPYPKLRIPIWRKGHKTLFILEEIGKEKPITVGIAIEGQQISSLQVLQFRESRGWEVKLQSFTKQFKGLFLKNNALDHAIDGISGATLSVRAVHKLAKYALALNQTLEVPRNPP